MHIYGEVLVLPDMVSPIKTYMTPPRGGCDCTGFVLWGEVSSGFYIFKNGVCIGGARTSATNPTVQLDYTSCPVGLTERDILTVTGEHVSDAPRVLRVVMLVNML